MSWDTFLGAPFNIASAALLLSIVARLTGYTPTILNIFGGDVHLYHNHIEVAKEQLTREAYPAPTLKINEILPDYESMCEIASHTDLAGLATDDSIDTEVAEEAVRWLDKLDPSWFSLENYQHHEALTAPMAV